MIRAEGVFSLSGTLIAQCLLYLYIRNETNMESFHQDPELFCGAWEAGSRQSRVGSEDSSRYMFLRRLG